jgi:serine protease Do
VTNAHVVDGAQEVEVSLGDKRSFPAEVIGADPKTDIAVLKVDAAHLPTLPLGNSDNVKVGDIVLAIGNPFGIGRTVTMGIVGATGRGGLGIEDYEDFIQTDAAINPGNSGGALVNTSGQLVGINTAILSRTGGNNGVGFAVPVNLSHDVVRQIVEHGEVRRGFLGVGIQDLTPAMAKAFQATDNHGAVISDVTPDSPAAKAGLERGDIIIALNKEPVEDARQLRLGVAAMAPGSEADVRVLRNGEPTDIPVTLGRFPGEEQKPLETSERKTGSYGLSVTELTPEIARELDLAADAGGVVVTAVEPDSQAAEAGIRRGDVIQEVNRKALNDVSSFREAIQSAEGDPLLLLVNRGGRTSYIVIESR